MQQARIDWIPPVLFGYVIIALIQPLLLPPMPVMSLSNFLLPFAGIMVLRVYWKEYLFRSGIAIFAAIIGVTLISNVVNGGLTTPEILWGLRWVKLFVLLWSAHYLLRNHRQTFEWMLVVLFLLIVLVNALQLMKVDAVIGLYATSTGLSEYAKNSIQESRVFGAMQNANNNALVMALFAIYFYFSNIRWKYLLMTLALILVLMTQSRTGLIAVGFVVTGSLLLRNIQLGWRRIALILGGFVVVLLMVWALNLHYVKTLLDGSAFESYSFVTRLEVLQQVMALNTESWLLGHGKILSIPELIGHSIDNEFAYVYLQYGVLGLFAVTGLIVYLAFLGMRQKNNWSWLAFLVVMLICGLTNIAFTNPECGVLFFVLFLTGVEKMPTKGNEQGKGNPGQSDAQ